jgi:hypothetical protein
MLLTALAIQNAKPKAKPYKLSDGGGLHLCVEPHGSKLWRFRYHFDSKEKMISFGSFPAIRLLSEGRQNLPVTSQRVVQHHEQSRRQDYDRVGNEGLRPA